MKKTAIFAIVLGMIFLGLATAVASIETSSDGNYILQNKPYTHSFTKASCTESNLCQDYEITCNGKEVVSLSPITGAVVQFDKNWRDPRSEEMKNKGC